MNGTSRGSEDASEDGGESAMEDEFDVVAGWTLDAIRQLGAAYAVPASCRGTSSPMLDWLGDTCGLLPGQILLDVGGGMGGPAAYAAEHHGVRPLNAEPMPRACRAAVDLFGIGSLVADGSRLPVRTGAVDVGWCLGVLCTTPDKAATLAELRRVLRPGSSLGLMVLTADEPTPAGAPEGNVFPSHGELGGLLTGAGFDVVAESDAADLIEAPPGWSERLERVQELVKAAHDGDPRMTVANEQQARMGALLDDGLVRSWLVHATAR